MRYFSKGSEEVIIPLGPIAGRLDKRVRRMCAMIALALTLGIFLTVVSDTIVQSEMESTNLAYGSDINIYLDYAGGWNGTGFVENVTFPATSDLTAIPGVSRVTLCQYFLPTIVGKSLVQAVAVNPSDYLATVDPSSKYTNGDPSEVLGVLSVGNYALVTDFFASQHDIKAGDEITVNVTVFDSWSFNPDPPMTYTLNLQVSHIVDELPGIGGDLIVGTSSLSSIPKEGFDRSANGAIALIDAEPDADQSRIAAEASQIFKDNGYGTTVHTLDEQLADIASSPDTGGLFTFLMAEFVTSMAVVLVGVAVTSSSTARLAMVSTVRSGGTEDFLRSVRKALATESGSIAVIGASVGIAVGILTAYLFGMMWVPQGVEAIGMRLSPAVVLIAVVSFVMVAVIALAFSLRGSTRGVAHRSDKP